MKNVIFLIATLILMGPAAHADSNAVNKWLGNLLQGRQLSCLEKKSGTHYDFSVKSEGLEVDAAGSSTGDIQSVDHTSVSKGQLKITVWNGPLGQDLIILKVIHVVGLAKGKYKSISGIDVYSEYYDGTTQKFAVTCTIH